MEQREIRESLHKLIAGYPHPRMALIPALWMLSEEEGRGDLLDLVAEACGVSSEEVSSILRVHPELGGRAAQKPTLCMAVSCYLRGAGDISRRLRSKPELVGETVQESAECLGYCFAGPVLLDSEGRLCRFLSSERNADGVG